MSVRILHCGKSIANYNLCIEHKVAGFTKRGKNIGDIIYLVVKVKKKVFMWNESKATRT